MGLGQAQETAYNLEGLVDHGYISTNDCTNIDHFLHGIKSTELEAVVNIAWAQPEKYGKHFDATVSYLCQMVMKKGYNMQFVHIAKTAS